MQTYQFLVLAAIAASLSRPSTAVAQSYPTNAELDERPVEALRPSAAPSVPDRSTAPTDVRAVAVSPAAVSPAAVSPAAVSPAAVSPVAVSPAAVSPAAVSPAAVRFKGFEVLGDGSDRRLRLGGLVQADGRFFFGEPATDTFAVRRARIDLRAILTSYLSARLHPELAGSRLSLLDAYITLGFVPELQLQVGKMKSPIGLELLQSTRDMPFPERGLPSLLVPNRDVGAILLGDLCGGAMSYAGGVFNGIADGTNGEEDDNQPFDVVGRLFFRPFTLSEIESLTGLGVGIAGSWGKRAGALPIHRTAGRQTFFGYADGVVADGEHTRIAPQGYYYNGPVGLLAEWVHSKQLVSSEVQRVNVDSSAWQVVGSVVIAGEAGYKGVIPHAELDLEASTWGAVELAVRYGQWQIEQQVFERDLAEHATASRAARSFGVSAAWWLTVGSRILIAYDHSKFDSAGAAADRAPEKVLITRLQTSM